MVWLLAYSYKDVLILNTKKQRKETKQKKKETKETKKTNKRKKGETNKRNKQRNKQKKKILHCSVKMIGNGLVSSLFK